MQFQENQNNILLEENQKLHQSNAILQNELLTLKDQLTKSLSLSSKLEEAYSKNSELLSQINKLNDEKEDFKHRLQINIQSYRELETSIKSEKENLSTSHTREINNLTNDYNEQINKLQFVIKNKDDKIQKLEQNIKETESDSNKYKTEMQQTYKALSQYFQLDLYRSDDLIHLLSQPITKTPTESTKETQTIEVESTIQLEIQNYKSTITHLKSKAQQLCSEYEEKISKLKQSIESIHSNHEQKVKLYENQIQELKHKNESQSHQMNEIILSKDAVIQENAKLKTQIRCASNECEAKQLNLSLQHNEAINNLTTKLHKAEESNDKLKMQIAPLIDQIKKYKIVYKQCKDQIMHNQQVINQLEFEIENARKDNENLSQKFDDKDKENKKLKENIHELNTEFKTNSIILNEKSAEIEKLKMELEKLSVIIETKKDEYAALENEKDELVKIMHEKDNKIAENEAQLDLSFKKCTNFENELRNVQQKLAAALEPINESSLLPLASWASRTIPEDLMKMITEIANNSSLQLPSKLKQLFCLIIEWYQKMTARISSENEEIKKQIFDNEQRIIEFSQFASYIFDTDFSNIFRDDQQQKELEKIVNNLRIEASKHEQKVNEYESEMINFLVFMDSNDLNTAREKIESLHQKISNYHEKSKNLKKKIAELTKLSKLKDKEYKTSIEQIKSEKNSIQEELFSSQKEVQNLNSQIILLKSQFEEQSKMSELTLHDQTVEFETKVAEYENQNSSLAQKIEELTILRQQSEESKIPLKTTIMENEKMIQMLHQKIDSKNKQIKEMSKHSEEEAQMLHSKIESELSIFKQKETKYKNLIDKISKENNDDLIKNEKRIEELESQIESLKSENNQFSVTIQSLELRNQTIKADFDRHKRLIESKMRTDFLSNELDFNNKLEECRKKLNETKIKMMGFIASNFCTIFNTKEELNDTNFERFIQNISMKLRSLMNTDWKLRELLKLGPNQSIEDAVSYLLLNNEQKP